MTTKTHSARTVQHLDFNARVDIIIPFHGLYDRVAKAIESIYRYTFSNVYHIYLVDDCSPNTEFIKTIAKAPNITCIRNEEQLGFGGALKRGFEKSQKDNDVRKEKQKPDHPYVVFFQSDCRAEDVNWLRGMGQTMLNLKDQNVKMVAPRTNNPGLGDESQKGDKGGEITDLILEANFLSLYCFMCHRELFSHVGGFLKEYPYGYYEDEEFAHRMKKYGYKQAVSGNSWVHHDGEATIRLLWRNNQEARKIMIEDNHARCLKDMRS